ncbi:MAG TPA: ABC transporter permease [Ramlibacter sp.]|uniref:MlaE family ABC transporter permease n=1 Tax=Ramlibacter sp. TaxID=1917967 RepID=UPI002D6E8C6F|nr:ABC transporter permease [Ramlibacter sp.]HZY19789.1 ABC transporter permease [Ramlibacter sp.]
MPSAPSRTQPVLPLSGPLLRRVVNAWRIVTFGAVLLVLALSPSSYRRADVRMALARHTWLDTAPILAGFSMLVTLLTMVLTRIVVVTAQSYGLSQYALEMVIRVLVLELIPLTAALFVALRCTIPNGAALAEMRHSGRDEALRRRGIDPVLLEVFPRMLAGAFSTITLAALSCVLATVLAYLAVYGFTLAGLPAYTRMFGHVFSPTVALIFALKTLFFSLAVAIIPMASASRRLATPGTRASAALEGLVRMFAVLLLLEALSLVGNYY